MLIEIRDRASSFVAYIIIGLLVISFALWGIQEYFGGGGGEVPVANVNGTEILLSEFNNQFQRRRQALQSTSGADYTQQYPDESVIKQQVIDNMVNIELLRQEVTDAGFRISDTSLIQRIQQTPQFQKDGKFDLQLYERLLQVQRYSKARFENELREGDKLKQFEVSLTTSSFMPQTDLRLFQKLAGQTRDFQYAVVRVDADTVTVSPQEVDDYYRENQLLYQVPERVKLAYVELLEEQLAGQIEITVEDARSIYTSQAAHYVTDELREARHILFKVPDEIATDAIEWDEAMGKANDILQQLEAGAAFAELAKRHSEDSLSAEKGGQIGFIAPGDFASAELEKALFSLHVGAHSQPIRTQQGIQILWLDEIQAAEQKPFQEVREQIINERKSQLAQQQFTEIADELASLVVEQPDDLQGVSETLGVQIRQTDWLTETSNAQIFAFPEIRSVAFSDDVLNSGLNSELIEVADGHVIALRLLEHKQSEQEPLDEVSEEIRQVIATRKATGQATAKGQKLLAQMQAGSSLDELSTENSLALISHGALRRDDSRVPGPLLRRAFELPRPAIQKTKSAGVVLADGSYALLELHEVMDGADQIDVATALQLSKFISYGGREFNAIMQAIKADASVQIFENNL